uniref:FAD_binding_2 domain-containing protein n=1 Tax=Heterorhabditis bacteriophora TaxID=37862 RepID=A0A1I7XA50_HETBA
MANNCKTNNLPTSNIINTPNGDVTALLEKETSSVGCSPAPSNCSLLSEQDPADGSCISRQSPCVSFCGHLFYSRLFICFLILIAHWRVKSTIHIRLNQHCSNATHHRHSKLFGRIFLILLVQVQRKARQGIVCLGNNVGIYFFYLQTFLLNLQAPGKDEPILIVGGGLAGLSSAIEAVQHGSRIILIDSEKNLGGNSAKASSGLIEVFFYYYLKNFTYRFFLRDQIINHPDFFFYIILIIYIYIYIYITL